MADSLIAGIVLHSGGRLLTRNVRHFERVEGLTLATFQDLRSVPIASITMGVVCTFAGQTRWQREPVGGRGGTEAAGVAGH